MSASNIVPLRSGQMPSVFAGRANLPDMNAAAQAGLVAGFAVVGYKGRNWRIKYRGDDQLLKDSRGVPLPTLSVVIVGVSPAISKQWYDKRYSEGDNEAPDCFSIDGMAPDAASPKKQCATCATCPQNIWGSRMNDNGKKAKACMDSRRIAVVPAGDIENNSYGGPMMLRVPPMSLSNLAKYTNEIGRFGAQPFMVITEMAFDWDVAYPLLKFTATGWLDDAQADAVAVAMEDPLIERMLTTASDDATADPAAEAAALAGGAPSPKLAQQAAAQAARAEIEAQAREAQAAVNRAQAAVPTPAVTAFAPQPQPQPQPQVQAQVQAQPQPAPELPEAGRAPAQAKAAAAQPTPTAKTTEAPAVLQPAPADMDQAIDDLLAS